MREFWLIIFVMVTLDVHAGARPQMVQFTSNNEVQSFLVPISKDPILSWIDVKEGTYPNVKAISSDIPIGKNISLLIYFYDKSELYDMLISNCIAYDSSSLELARNMFVLYNKEETQEMAYGKIERWKQTKASQNHTTLFYANFKSFKFPDVDKVYLTCNIELCYESCSRKSNEV